MYKTWTFSADNSDVLARALEAHLNEFAQEVVDVSYAISDRHYVLATYIEIILPGAPAEGGAVAVAEQILDEAQL
ncbi:MAG: hypothetical protein NVSMB52_17360 [Chloroflexota bacterium]